MIGPGRELGPVVLPVRVVELFLGIDRDDRRAVGHEAGPPRRRWSRCASRADRPPGRRSRSSSTSRAHLDEHVERLPHRSIVDGRDRERHRRLAGLVAVLDQVVDLHPKSGGGPIDTVSSTTESRGTTASGSGSWAETDPRPPVRMPSRSPHLETGVRQGVQRGALPEPADVRDARRLGDGDEVHDRAGLDLRPSAGSCSVTTGSRSSGGGCDGDLKPGVLELGSRVLERLADDPGTTTSPPVVVVGPSSSSRSASAPPTAAAMSTMPIAIRTSSQPPPLPNRAYHHGNVP